MAEILQTVITLGKGNVDFKFLFQSSYLSKPLNSESTINPYNNIKIHVLNHSFQLSELTKNMNHFNITILKNSNGLNVV